MLFSSLTFLFIFLPLFLIIYYLANPKYRNFILFLFSLFFYTWGEVKYVWVLLLSTVVDFTIGQCLKRTDNPLKRRIYLFCSLFVNFGLLIYFKYSTFLMELTGIPLPNTNHLPIGISFYTFQTLSYSIDVYRKKVEPLDNIIDFGAYVCMFMQLIAGPIVRFIDVSKEIRERSINKMDLINGWKRFVLGLSKKVLLANQIGLLWENILSLGTWSFVESWLGIIAYALQIYFDFSGYSVMAIGLGQMIGFKFPNNFDDPYYATSITNFWRRWHMTLGVWFREYVYIPLGGNRVSFLKWVRNILFVWMLTGLWHGASLNFVLWGLYYGVLLLIEKTILKNIDQQWYNHIYAIFFVLIGWAIFAIEDLTILSNYFVSMFNFTNLITTQGMYQLSSYIVLIILEIGLCHPKIMKKFMNSNHIVCLVLFILCICYLIDGSYNPFLYFRF